MDDLIYGKGILTWPDEDKKTARKLFFFFIIEFFLLIFYRYEGLWKDNFGKGLTVEQISQNQSKKKK